MTLRDQPAHTTECDNTQLRERIPVNPPSPPNMRAQRLAPAELITPRRAQQHQSDLPQHPNGRLQPRTQASVGRPARRLRLLFRRIAPGGDNIVDALDCVVKIVARLPLLATRTAGRLRGFVRGHRQVNSNSFEVIALRRVGIPRHNGPHVEVPDGVKVPNSTD